MKIVRQSKAQSTGTTILVVDNRDESFRKFTKVQKRFKIKKKWYTVCQDHNSEDWHYTKSDAVGWASCPESWCPICQKGGE